jgi:hypothetical protein
MKVLCNFASPSSFCVYVFGYILLTLLIISMITLHFMVTNYFSFLKI